MQLQGSWSWFWLSWYPPGQLSGVFEVAGKKWITSQAPVSSTGPTLKRTFNGMFSFYLAVVMRFQRRLKWAIWTIGWATNWLVSTLFLRSWLWFWHVSSLQASPRFPPTRQQLPSSYQFSQNWLKQLEEIRFILWFRLRLTAVTPFVYLWGHHVTPWSYQLLKSKLLSWYINRFNSLEILVKN